MIAIENSQLTEYIISKLYKERKRDKLGVTDLNCCKRATIFQRHGIERRITEGDIITLAEGRGSHYILEEVFDAKEVQIEKDEIIGHPDASHLGTLIEIYTTIMSSNNTLQEMVDKSVYFRQKIRQMMDYCYMKGTNEIDLVILFRMGNYKDFKPKIVCKRIVFTDEELKSNWEVMMKKKEYILSWDDKEIDDLPEKDPVEGECDFCGYSYICFKKEETFTCKNESVTKSDLFNE
jgi:CRISPR/Cas system-associated exonuclease Cas4 (RecB family)